MQYSGDTKRSLPDFEVAVGRDDTRAAARLSDQVMREYELLAGDTVVLGAINQLAVRVIVQHDLNNERKIQLDRLQCQDLGVKPGEQIQIRKKDLKPAHSVTICLVSGPHQDLSVIRERLIDRPVTLGAHQRCSVDGGAPIVLRVVSTNPSPFARITRATRLSFKQPSAPSGTDDYATVGGLERQTAAVRELVEWPMRYPELFARLGITPARGVLLTGPPGSGKTLLARAVSQAADTRFFALDAPEIVTKHYGESEARLREIFQQAERQAPSIIFIDEIDAIAQRRDMLSGEKQLERRIVAQLLTAMDGLSKRGQVVVMAATNLPNALDPALRRPGRFEREIAFGTPDRAERSQILAIHLQNVPLARDVDVNELVEQTQGFVGADLAALVREAGMAALARTVTQETLVFPEPNALQVELQDLRAALQRVRPSGLRGLDIEGKPARWRDIGGHDALKQRLEEAVVWPLRHADACAALGLELPAGILLSGPPGTGKTLLARALAVESGLSLISVRGAAILSQFLGEAERSIADLFARARNAAPCIVFFDELDALTPRRERGDPALNRLVAQLLTEIDGVQASRGVVLLGATNRVDAIDPALLRPGRFDLVLKVATPDLPARRAILGIHTRAMPLDAADLDALAEQTAGWSGAALSVLCQTATRQALRRYVQGSASATVVPAVSAQDFADALKECRQSEAARGSDITNRDPEQETIE